MTRSARAFWIVGPGVGEIREEALLERPPSYVLVQALYSGISRGTESIVFSGRVPASEYERMRCPNQRGAFPFPVKYGYASVGRIVEGPDADSEPKDITSRDADGSDTAAVGSHAEKDLRSLAGRSVFCLHPHQTFYVLPKSEVIVLPDDVPPARAVLAANLETALNAMWDAAPLVGDRITIVGGGVVGCLCAYLASRIAEVDVELVDVRRERASVAVALGARFCVPGSATRDRDLVFHASGTAEGLRTALSLCAPGSEVVELSWFADASISLPLGEAFHSRRLALRASQVGTLSPRARARFTRQGRLALAVSMLRDSALDVLVTGESAFESLPQTMAGLTKEASDALCHRIRYG